jgi:hypothetical protein
VLVSDVLCGLEARYTQVVQTAACCDALSVNSRDPVCVQHLSCVRVTSVKALSEIAQASIASWLNVDTC